MNNPIQKMYEPIAVNYERVNHLLTLGLDTGWRRKLIKIAAQHGGANWADLCTGTGETAVGLYKKTGAQITGIDFSPAMLAEARKKSAKIEWIEAGADALPFPDNHFDGITLSFATRNLNQSREILISRVRELKRILKPGGHFLILETSQPKNRLIRFGFHLFIKGLVKTAGNFISNTTGSYHFLAASMLTFYSADELAGILNAAGFAIEKIHPLLFGAISIHECRKSS